MPSPAPERALGAALLVLVLCLFTACRSPRSALPDLDPAELAAERESQRVAFLEADEARLKRLRAIAFPLLREGAALFPGRAQPTIGIATLADSDLQEPYHATAIEIFGLGPLPQVRGVVPGSPAEAAGFAVGDILTHVRGQALNPEQSDGGLEALQEAMEVDVPLEVTVRRGERAITLTVRPAALVPYRVQLVYRAEINARATGQTIELNMGMLAFCEEDEELAFIFAHELAHNALRHQRDFVYNYLLGTAADLALLALRVPSANVLGLTAIHYPSSAYEAEADYVALYLMARAGYDLEPLRDFWRRMALLGPERRARGPTLWTHPDPAERQLRLEQAIEEIQQRRAAGLPLVPAER